MVSEVDGQHGYYSMKMFLTVNATKLWSERKARNFHFFYRGKVPSNRVKLKTSNRPHQYSNLPQWISWILQLSKWVGIWEDLCQQGIARVFVSPRLRKAKAGAKFWKWLQSWFLRSQFRFATKTYRMLVPNSLNMVAYFIEAFYLHMTCLFKIRSNMAKIRTWKLEDMMKEIELTRLSSCASQKTRNLCAYHK